MITQPHQLPKAPLQATELLPPRRISLENAHAAKEGTTYTYYTSDRASNQYHTEAGCHSFNASPEPPRQLCTWWHDLVRPCRAQLTDCQTACHGCNWLSPEGPWPEPVAPVSRVFCRMQKTLYKVHCCSMHATFTSIADRLCVWHHFNACQNADEHGSTCAGECRRLLTALTL